MTQFARDKTYKQWLHSARWQGLRLRYMTDHPWCEDCLKMRRRIPATDCHHKQPVLSFATQSEREFMMFNVNNLSALCAECHKKRHNRKEQRQHQRERAEGKIRAFVEKYKAPQPPQGEL